MKTLRLGTALSLILGAAGLAPVLLVLAAGWLPLYRHMGLWTLPSVEHALDSALSSSRTTVLSLRRIAERQVRSLAPEAFLALDGDSATLCTTLSDVALRQGLDLVQAYREAGDGLELVASAGPQGAATIDSPTTIPFPAAQAGEMGPQRPTSIEIRGHGGSWIGVPAYRWREGADPNRTPPDAALVVGVSLGADYFPRVAAASEGLLFYRRFEDVSRVMRTAYISILGLVLVCAVGGSLWLARRVARAVSTPIERLASAMMTIRRDLPSPSPVHSRFVEIEALAEAYARMNSTLAGYEERLRESEQVRGARETARFVAHEIRNSLTPVQASLAVLDRRLEGLTGEERGRAVRAVELIRAETERMARLASTFSEYAHMPDPDPQKLSVMEIIGPLAQEEVPDRIDRTLRCPQPVPVIIADRDEMLRAFRNLLRNAVEATPDRGRIDVTVDRGEGGSVRVIIEDDGSGLDAASMKQAFQPGFTTKSGGSGLGLALVKRTMIRYGGTIRLESEPGKGTRCVVELPGADDSGGEPRPEEQRRG